MPLLMALQCLLLVSVLLFMEWISGYCIQRYGSYERLRLELFGGSISQSGGQEAESPIPRHGYPPKAPEAKEEWKDLEYPILYSKYKYSPNLFARYRGLPFEIPVKSGRVSRARPNGALLYDISLDIDAYARRFFPETAKGAHPDKFLLFIGCSFVFGDGLEANQTIAYFASKSLQEYRAYNYGMSGVSLGGILLRMGVIEGGAEIPEKTGWVIYPFLDQHLSRLIGTMQILGSGLFYKSPHFYMDASGELRTDGSFQEAWPIRTKIFQWLMERNFVRFFQLDYPAEFREKDLLLAAKIIEKMQARALALHARGLIVVFYPGQWLAKRLIPHLEKSGIRYLDYSNWDLGRITRGPAYIPHDGHPTAETNAVLGASIAEELRKNRLFRD